jgi:hypothetical protein
MTPHGYESRWSNQPLGGSQKNMIERVLCVVDVRRWLFFQTNIFSRFSNLVCSGFFFALWCDYRPITPGGINATVICGPQSMSMLQKATGLVIAAMVIVRFVPIADTVAAVSEII